jgi:hypothetical protein
MAIGKITLSFRNFGLCSRCFCTPSEDTGSRAGCIPRLSSNQEFRSLRMSVLKPACRVESLRPPPSGTGIWVANWTHNHFTWIYYNDGTLGGFEADSWLLRSFSAFLPSKTMRWSMNIYDRTVSITAKRISINVRNHGGFQTKGIVYKTSILQLGKVDRVGP